MNIRRVLALATIPFVIGTFGFVAPNQANAQSPAKPRPEISQQRPRPQNELPKPDKKPQIKHQQRRPQEQKRSPKPHDRDVNQNQRPYNNR
ncbi:hypothetical protein VF14_25115 [Nostoc linckia z18]|uniref:Uncharacterized protein n=2 Tax=Nostoc linckia TaxID=92942 RepID=A0A9Q5Z8E2_NOSLI|nr:hypothetical protein [Nostoc linckia]PHK39350.1 hypothetical protein VF12_14655 [Nostoc linckia z15]PHK43803.1 hypothetical protein VF13_25215 [Nostoc linckia z16]PHJ61656.1 hypothetical protein VF03_32055 [Nostoc linckia z2]PHJ65720.1 hypothetical protein VF02_10070 [Nostoc linckia z1]PHJ70513.1 hypothetical protein VF05_10465 [Nostoc linckia z3]